MKSLEEFKKEYVVQTELGIDSSFGKILTIIDFGNVNYWFNDDRQDFENKALAEDQKIRINLDGLRNFVSLFSNDTRFYYGHDPKNTAFLFATKKVFRKVFTKPIQRVRHHLTPEEITSNTRSLFSDKNGSYVYIPKCNFDVEITVDTIRLMDTYDTLALFSSDADFISLIRFLKGRGKKVVLFKGGNITGDLRKEVTKVINAQNIKKHIADVFTKQKPGV